MDALSEVFRLARFKSEVVVDVTGQSPWCVSVPSTAASGALTAHLVLGGRCTLKAGSQEPVALEEAEMAIVVRGDPHLLGHPIDAPASSLWTLVKAPVAGELPSIRIGGRGEAMRWVVLSMDCERHLADTLLDALPPVVRVSLAGAPALAWLVDALGLHLSSSDAPSIGSDATRAALASLVFVEALRRHILALPAGGTGWLAGLNDRYVGRALALVHGRPADPWTVERLGRQVGLSRSALAERFGEVMGEPIFAFLTRWRLQVAAETLLTTPRSIESVAADAGYESPGAFSHAFKRMFGRPPSLWRKRPRRKRSAAKGLRQEG